MKVLILGASGATGRLVTSELRKRGVSLRLVARENGHVPNEFTQDLSIEIIRGSILEFDKSATRSLIADCDAVVSCLGHNLTLKGIFGHPRMLVSQALQKICTAIMEEETHRYKIVLMNTTGNILPGESSSMFEKAFIAALDVLLPPQRDNVAAARYLSQTIGTQQPTIEWVAVRPDTLKNSELVTPYDVYDAPIRSPLFNAGKTSRINVGHFFAELLTNADLWDKWRFKLPVIYNQE